MFSLVVLLRRRLDVHTDRGLTLADVHDAGRRRLALVERVLQAEPVGCRLLAAVQRREDPQPLLVQLDLGLLRVDVAVAVGGDLAFDLLDRHADVRAAELAHAGLVRVWPRGVARAAEQVLAEADVRSNRFGEGVGDGCSHLIHELAVLVLPDVVRNGRHRVLDRLVERRPHVLPEHVVPALGGRVDVAALLGRAEAVAVLVAERVELPKNVLVLVQRPARTGLDQDLRLVLGVGHGGFVAVTDLTAVGVRVGTVVDDVVPAVARNVDGLLLVRVEVGVTDGLVGPDHLVDLAVVPTLAVTDDESAHGGRSRHAAAGGQRAAQDDGAGQCSSGAQGALA